MSPRRTRRIVVTAVGTPPPLPLRPFVDEVLRALDEARARRVTVPDSVTPSQRESAPRTRPAQTRGARKPQRVGRDTNAHRDGHRHQQRAPRRGVGPPTKR
jgi:hypothetical protein